MRLDRNQRQSRIEEKMLGKNAVHPGGNVQPRGGYRGGSYRGRGGQITWRTGGPSTGGGYKGGGGNMFNRERTQIGPRRDPNTMDVNKGKGGDRTYYVYGRWSYMAKNCWKRYKERVVEIPQELAKESGEQ